MKFVATVLAYLLSLIVIACVALVAVIVLAGPHAGLLPYGLEVAVVVSGWLSILILPVLLARKVWHRFTRHGSKVAEI